LDALRSINENNAADAQSRLEALLAEDAIYAGGQAAKQMFALLLKQAEAAVKTGDIAAALRFYQIAANVPVADHKAAIDGAAYARSITPTSTAMPTASSASPTAPGPYAAVRGEAVNVRAGPGQAYRVLGQVRDGERLAITGRNVDSSWFAICMGEAAACPPDQIGWVAADLVDAFGLGTLPAITPPPPTTTTPPARTAPPSSATPANRVACIQGQVLDTRGGAPLNGWTVAIQGPGLSKTYRTWNKGAYQFVNLAPGAYTVAIEAPGGWQPISPRTTTVSVIPGAECVTVDFWNEREARLEPPPPR
jgi:hypothetical protein